MTVAHSYIKTGCCPLLKRMASFFLFLMLFSLAKSQVITVNQDGTGDFTVIQDAVNASSNGDTVIVYPGVYFENVNLTAKGIVFASTWVIFHEDSLISQTIIDGNQVGSCIRSLSGSSWMEIIGFTLVHGTGTNYLESMFPYLYGSGGGIYLSHSKAIITKCRIMNNFGWHGAGIHSTASSINLVGNTICYNWAVGGGGGIRTAASNVVFDSIQLNNVYLNYSYSCSDIAVLYNDSIQKIWLDTCTVLNPDRYYIGKLSDWSVHTERPPVSVLNGKIDQLNADLYVSLSGEDSNSGLSPDNPFKTISYALLKIASDSVKPKTVHIADGVYSNQLTGEHTPIQLKNYVNIVGKSMENTIIDCENKYEGARFAFGQDYTYVKNITFLNGNGYYTMLNGGISTGYSRKLILDSVALIGSTGNFYNCIYSDSDDTVIVRNSIIKDCRGYKTIEMFVNYNEPPRYNELISCKISGNHPDTSYDGRHLSLWLSGSDFEPNWNKTKIINCLFNDNTDSLFWTGIGGTVAIHTASACQLDIINSTIVNNMTVNDSHGGAIGVSEGSEVNIYNSILYGNYAYQGILINNSSDEANTMSINYSLVQDGLDGIMDFGSYNQVIWGDGNLDSNPVFLGTEQFPYAIDSGSPCIDAGTLDLPPWITLPEFDIAGNPRVWGESVDMGAYEYGPWVSVTPVVSRKSSVVSQVQVSPNPFSYGTYITYELKEKGRLNISVYSISGMKVKTLVNNSGSIGDKGSVYWDGKDQNSQALPVGVYFIRMTMDGKEKETVKVVRE